MRKRQRRKWREDSCSYRSKIFRPLSERRERITWRGKEVTAPQSFDRNPSMETGEEGGGEGNA